MASGDLRTSHPTRRFVLGAVALAAGPASADDGRFIAEAFRQRDLAVAAGDQSYGAVLVLDGRIVGLGPSRVVAERDQDAHAERVALRQALAAGTARGATIFATSRPCPLCQAALARAGVATMRVGRDGIDAGPPRVGGS